MSVFNFDGYCQFEEWCVEHRYDPDTHYDSESEPHKRNTYESFYIKHLDKELYAQVSVEMSYDYGMGMGDIEAVGLIRVEKEVVVKQVSYV